MLFVFAIVPYKGAVPVKMHEDMMDAVCGEYSSSFKN